MFHTISPSTFADFRKGLGATWQHAQGNWFRNDFVDLPLDWTFLSCKSWISHGSAWTLMSALKEDHRAAVVHICRRLRPWDAPRRPARHKLPTLSFPPIDDPPGQPGTVMSTHMLQPFKMLLWELPFSSALDLLIELGQRKPRCHAKLGN